MIGFVEESLPAEWESQWESIQSKSGHTLEPEEGQYIDNSYQMMLVLILLPDSGMSKLERKFAELMPDPALEPLLPVIQGLMRFLPSCRLTAKEALDLLGDTGDCQ